MQGPLIFTPEYYARMRENEAASWWNAGMRRVAEVLLASIPLPGRGVLLDVGCGSGQTLQWFLDAHPMWRAAGLDVSPEGLRAARGLGQRNVGRASALDIPFRSSSIDLVISLDVLQHLPLGDGAAGGNGGGGGDTRALAEIRRVLRPGGYALLRTNAQMFPRTPDDPRYDFHKYEPAELRGKLEAAGFAVLRLSRLNSLPGLAEIPRELRASRDHGAGYHGILGTPRTGGALRPLFLGWLALEGRLVRAGWRLPLGRTLMALCRA